MPKSKPTWRSVPDEVLLRMTPDTTGNNESLNPTPATILRAITGDPAAREVIASYAFRFPVTTVQVLPCA